MTNRSDSERQRREAEPLFFLLGPHGAGKSVVGAAACRRLGYAFVDLSAPVGMEGSGRCGAQEQGALPRSGEAIETDIGCSEEALRDVILRNEADVVAVPCELQQDRRVRKFLRASGCTVLLWAHPEDMQVRSGRSEPLFTPVGRLKTRGGFGGSGTGCREFRSLDRTSHEYLILADETVEEAAELLAELFEGIRQEALATPSEQAGISGWVDGWVEDAATDRRVAELIVDAMAHAAGAQQAARSRGGGCI